MLPVRVQSCFGVPSIVSNTKGFRSFLRRPKTIVRTPTITPMTAAMPQGSSILLLAALPLRRPLRLGMVDAQIPEFLWAFEEPTFPHLPLFCGRRQTAELVDLLARHVRCCRRAPLRRIGPRR